MEKNDSVKVSAAQLEALLFIYGDPLDVKKAAKVLGATADAVKTAVDELRKEFESAGRGLALLEHDGSLQLVTKAEYGPLLQTVLKAELNEALSPASLETLSIVAYAGPVSRAEIDYIRGVNSSFTVRALLLRGLISRETDPQRGNAFLYSPSVELLHHLGVTRAEELPEAARFRTLVAEIKNPAPPAANPPPAVTP